MKKLFSLVSALVLSLTMLSACAENPANTDYIGVDSAKTIAFENAGVTSEDSVKDLDVELDRGLTDTVYEVSFDFEGYEYEYDIDAVSGEIVRNHRELDSLPPENFDSAPETTQPSEAVTAAPPATTAAPETPVEALEQVTTAAAETAPDGTVISASLISADEAKRIALEHAGLSESEVWDLEAERDVERGVQVYDVSFETEGYDYDYDINAVTGEIVRADKERDRNNKSSQPAKTTAATTAQSTDYIGEEAAKKAAFDHAGLKESDVWELKCKLEREDGIMVYDISFETDGYDYDYEINATTGAVVKNEKERDSTNISPSQADANGYIGYDRAKEIALDHAGLTADGVTKLEVELDSEHTKVVYDVSFDANGYEYDYEIDAVTGEILKSDKERD